MAKTPKAKYSNHRAYDGAPLKEGEVLVPMWVTAASKKYMTTAIEENFTTWKFAGIEFLIAFAPIAEDRFDDYMAFFWHAINDYLENYRAGRCVIGMRMNGTPQLCPKTNPCTDCAYRNSRPRYNPRKDFIPSFSDDYLHENSSIENATSHQMSVEEEAILEDTFLDLVEHLRQIKPRYAQIVTLGLAGLSEKEIIDKLGLSPSWGYAEYKKARELTLEYWNRD